MKTSLSFHIDFQETLRFDPASFADASDFIKRADNALRTVQPFSFPPSIKDSLSNHDDSQECVCQAPLSAVARLKSRESLNVPSCKNDDSSNVIRMDHFISTTPYSN